MQVELAADPATGLYTLTFTDTQQQRYRATKLHFAQFCEVSEELVVGRGTGPQQVLVSFASRAAAASCGSSASPGYTTSTTRTCSCRLGAAGGGGRW